MLPRPIIAITLVVAFISQDVFGQTVTNSTSILSPTTSIFSTTVTPTTASHTTSTASLNQTATTTTSQTQTATTSTSQTQTATTSTTKTISPTGSTPGGISMVPTTSSPADRTCGEVTFVWKKPWNVSYKGDDQFASKVETDLQIALEADKYINVNVSDLNVQKENEDIRVKFKLCLVHSDEERYLVDELKKLLGKLNNNTITGLTFEASGVKFKDWEAKDGECEKCSKGAGGPFIIEGKCEPKDKYSCDGLKTTKESSDCVQYCSASVQKMSTFILVLGTILAFSVNFWK